MKYIYFVLFAVLSANALAGPPTIESLVRAGINARAAEVALRAYSQNRASGRIRNDRFMSIVDYTLPVTRERLYVINMQTGTVEYYFVSHARNSGGTWVVSPSNQEGSRKSPTGAMRVNTERGNFPGWRNLYLSGLESANSNLERRRMYFHARRGNDGPEHSPGAARPDLSDGCFFTEPRDASRVLSQIAGGSLLYSYWNREDLEQNRRSGR